MANTCYICQEDTFTAPTALCTPCAQCKTACVCHNCLQQYLRTALATEIRETPHQCSLLRAPDKQFIVARCPMCKDPIFVKDDQSKCFDEPLQKQLTQYSNMQKHGLLLGVTLASGSGLAAGLLVGGVFGVCGGVLATGAAGAAGWLFLKLRKFS